MYIISVIDANSNPLANTVVTACNADGTPVKTASGDPVASITDATGACTIDDNVDTIAQFVPENQAYVQTGYVTSVQGTNTMITITMAPLSSNKQVAGAQTAFNKASGYMTQHPWVKWALIIGVLALIVAIWYYFFHSTATKTEA